MAVNIRGVLLALAFPWPGASQVVVEGIAPASAAERAGIAAGDVLLGWSRPSHGALRRFGSFLEVDSVRMEEAPRGPLDLLVERGGAPRRVRIGSGEWGLDARPAMPEPLLSKAREVRASGEGVAGRPELAEPAACWLAVRSAEDLAARRLGSAARAAYQKALPCVERLGGKGARARLLVSEGAALRLAEDLPDAAEVLREALAVAPPGSLVRALALHNVGVVSRQRGDLAAAERSLGEARALRRRAAPRSLELSYTLNQLGIVAWLKSDLTRAEALCREALALARRAGPRGVGEADALNNLALVARDRGDLDVAERLLGEATEIRRGMGPGSAVYGYSLVNLAALAGDRGDHSRADALLEEALATFERIAPGGLTSAHILNNLGVLARDRGDFPAAEELLRRALLIREKLAPGSLEVATTLGNLAAVLEADGRFPEAAAANERALEVRQRLAPDGLLVSSSYEAMGSTALGRKDLAGALAHFERALALREKAGEGTLVGQSLVEVGEVLHARGELEKAEPVLRRALALRSRQAPGSLNEALAAHALGAVLRDRGDLAGARAAFDRALSAIDAQLGRIGGTDEGRADFASRRDEMFHDQIDLLERTGRPHEAFLHRERARARSLLASLAGRDLEIRAVPAALRARVLERRTEERRLREQLAAADEARAEILQVRLRALRTREARLDALAERSSPRLTALRAPRPLDASSAAAALEPGGLFLAFTVLPSRTLLFVLPAGGSLAVRSLPIGREELETEVATYRSLLLGGRERLASDPALDAQARRLFDLLLAPAAPELARARRLLLSPDGPLELLPFVALRAPSGQYLVEAVPLHTVLSMTLHAELSRGRGRRGEGAVVFGGAATPAPANAEVTVGSPFLRYRRGLAPLPGAREEAKAVARVLGGATRLYVGEEATEERARNAGRDARYVHFAVHALLDPRLPAESGLALVRGESGAIEDGLLQAWEVVRSVRLRADLVSLSGCETALGGANGGEGLLGLARAFHFAGARSVLASLWSVPDRATSALMTAFYRSVRAGTARDVALRNAELSLIRGGYPHPFQWAGFVLSGDPL